MERLYRERVERARVARLATVTADGSPHLVPVCFVLDGDVVYSAVDDKPKRSRRLQRIENLRRNPSASILVDHYDDDWTRLWWVRLDGRTRVLAGGEECDRALTLLARKYRQYSAAPPGGPVIAIDVDRWRSWAYEDSTPEEDA